MVNPPLTLQPTCSLSACWAFWSHLCRWITTKCLPTLYQACMNLCRPGAHILVPSRK